MKIEKIIFDTETTGTNPKKNSILTAYFMGVDENLTMVSELSLAIAPKPEHIIEQEALDVNGINMEEHLARPDIMTHEQAGTALKDWLKGIHILNGGKKYDKAIPMGHNITFDMFFIFEQLISKQEWEEHVSYRFNDSMIVANFLKDIEMLPKEVGSLVSLVKFYGIDGHNAHNAKGDVQVTAQVYSKLVQSMLSLKNNVSAQPQVDLLKELD
jgi:DNA polymerase III epsilon subunit-like protein